MTFNLTQSAPPKDVTFPVANGYRITDEGGTTLSGKTVQVSEETYKFNITVTGSNPAASKPFVEAIGGEANVTEPTVERNTYQYELQNITENTEIIVTLETKTFTIKYTKDDETGFTTDIQNGKTVSYGSDYSFTVTPIDGYNPPTVSYTMEGQSGGTPLISGNNYTISNITGDVTITITTPSAKKRTVTFVPGPGYSFTEAEGDTPINDSKEVSALSDLKFKVKVDAGYSDTNIQVAVNGVVVLKNSDGTYTAPKSTADQSVTVTGVAQNQYTVALRSGAGYTLQALDPTTVNHGGSFRFTVTVDSGYNGKISVKIDPSEGGSCTSEESQGVYTVTNITKNITISIDGLSQKTCTVEKAAEGTANADVKFSGNESGTATYGGSLNFTVTPHTGYKVADNGVTVSTDSGTSFTVVKGNGNNYTVTGVTEACKVHVTVTPVTITVTYQNDSPTNGSHTVPYTYDPAKGENLSSYLEKPTDVRYYTFEGWKSTMGGEAETDKKFENADATATVYGTWSVDIKSLFQLYLRAETDKAGAAEGSTTLDLIVDWSPFDGALTLAEGQKAKITNAGILYAGSDFTVTEEALETEIKGRLEQEAHGDPFSQGVTGTGIYYYCYSNQTGTDSRDSTKTVRFRVKNGTNRYAIGWVAVQVNGENYIVFSELSNGNHSQHVFGPQG